MPFGFVNSGPSVLTKIVKDVLFRLLIITKAFCCVPVENIASFTRKPRTNVTNRFTNVLHKYKSIEFRNKPPICCRNDISFSSGRHALARYSVYVPKQSKKINNCFQSDVSGIYHRFKPDKRNFKMWKIKEIPSEQRKYTKELTGLIIDKGYVTHDGKVIVKLKKKPFTLKDFFTCKVQETSRLVVRNRLGY